MPSEPTEAAVVQIWLGKAIRILEVIQGTHPAPGTPLGDLETVLRQMHQGTGNADALSKEAESIARRLRDPRLRGIFLAAWASYSADEGRLAEAESLVQRALETLPKNAPFECFAQARMAGALILFWKGDLLGHQGLIRKIAEEWPKRSPRRFWLLYGVGTDLAQYGRLAELAEWPREDQRGALDRGDREVLALVDFLNAVQTGDLERAKVLGARDFQRHTAKDEQTLIRYHLDFLKLQEGLWTPPSLSAPQDDLLPQRVLAVLYELTRGKPDSALACARTLEIDSKDLIWAQYGWTTILRAELACGNHLAAKRLLDKERARSGEHYLDGLFLARMERLAGHPEAAQEHFSRLLERIAFYKAEGRLDFELKMACELPSSDVFKWTRAAKPTTSRTPKPLPTKPLQEPAPTPGAPRMIGTSPALGNIRKLIRDLASHDAPVLITGETGTGKDLVARAIHYEGPRKKEPFLAVNCSGITESLLASELFGHVKGAFTGAEKDRPGLFEQAGKGTLFLDEIGDISPGLQVALLRVLDQREIRPVGADRDKKIQCRIVAATNADLEAKVKAGNFREDLLFRLQRLMIHIPPLRERKEDLRDLASHFLNEGRPGDMHATFSQELSELFAGYAWPGNVRELRNTIERVRVLNSDALRYDVDALDPGLSRRLQKLPPPPPAAPSRAGAPPSAEGRPDDEAVLSAGSSPLRRLQRLRGLFLKHRTLTRAEVKAITGVSTSTAAKDLKSLCTEGFIRKTPKSHYYALRT